MWRWTATSALVGRLTKGAAPTAVRRSLRTVGRGSACDCGAVGAGDDGLRQPLRVTLIEGPGSGPTVCAAVRRVLDAADVQVLWDRRTLRVHQDPYTDRRVVNADVVQSAMDTGLVLCGPISDSARSSATLTLHKALDTFVDVRLFATVHGHQPFGRVRMVNIRDNVSSEYSEIEHTIVPGVVQSIKTVTRLKSEAVAKFAFDYAVNHGHYRVTVLHKANVMRLSDGVFLRACRRMSACYPDVEYEEEKLDVFSLRVVENPGRYSVLLTPSLYGAFASAACSTLAGGEATVPFAAYGQRVAVFSAMAAGDADTSYGHHQYRRHDDRPPVHTGDAHSMANPTGMIRSAAWMLSHVGMTATGLRVDTALHNAIGRGVRTIDMGGTASCAQFTDAVIHDLLSNTARPFY